MERSCEGFFSSFGFLRIVGESRAGTTLSLSFCVGVFCRDFRGREERKKRTLKKASCSSSSSVRSIAAEKGSLSEEKRGERKREEARQLICIQQEVCASVDVVHRAAKAANVSKGCRRRCLPIHTRQRETTKCKTMCKEKKTAVIPKTLFFVLPFAAVSETRRVREGVGGPDPIFYLLSRLLAMSFSACPPSPSQPPTAQRSENPCKTVFVAGEREKVPYTTTDLFENSAARKLKSRKLSSST